MRKDRVLFTYLHLAASKECTDALTGSGITAIAYETVQLPDGSLPLLAPMSEVAGRMAPQVGAHHLQRDGGGRGVLMGGVSGVYAAKVVVLGAGVSGMNAAAIALGMQAEVLLIDKNIAKLSRRTRSTRGTARRSRRPRMRSSGPRSTPTWSSARCWCLAPRRRR
jgi:alanine dehydrogenase